MKLTAFAPASIGNVSVGFDVLGAGLSPIDGTLLGDKVSIESADEFSLESTGRFADRLPPGMENNIVFACYEFFNTALTLKGVDLKPCKMALDKALPIGSGLGSSASSIVAAFYALNAFYDYPFENNELLYMMGECEGEISGSVHYDNVAPALFGGMTLMTGLQNPICEQVPVFKNWYWAMCYSGISVSTAAAREILPKQFDMATTLAFGRQLANFIHASHTQNEALAGQVFFDVLAEEHRQVLLPHFAHSREFAMAQGAIGFGISGSGPTVFAACKTQEQAQTIADYLAQEYIQNEDGFAHVCKIDTQGTRLV